MKKLNIGFAITGSFCTFNKVLQVMEELIKEGHNIVPIFSFSVKEQDTRFGTAASFHEKVVQLTGNQPLNSLQAVEPIGPKGLIDILVIAPCTGNTLAKLSNAISDTPVTMAAKSQMRNNKPVVIALSTNDGLGFSLASLAKLIASKNFFFVPFGQDDPTGKPKSLIADYDKIPETISCAINNVQYQPVLLRKP